MKIFGDFFDNVKSPVVIYRDDESRHIVYENQPAKFLLNPVDDPMNQPMTFERLIRISSDKERFYNAILDKNEKLFDFYVSIKLQNGEEYPANLYANRFVYEGDSYVKLCVYSVTEGVSRSVTALTSAIKIAHNAENTDYSIQNMIQFAGTYLKVSRSYIFESSSETTYSNTYEWCTAGVEPYIHMLQNLKKEEHLYNETIARGFLVYDDVRMVANEQERKFFQMQGIKAIIMVPLISPEGRTGYLGFDDCVITRKWSQEEIRFIKDVAEVLTYLIYRRDMEKGLSQSLDILKTVSDNSDDFMIVRDIETKQMLFGNILFLESVGLTAEELTGKRCDELMVLHGHYSCDQCPLDVLGSKYKKNNKYVWEHQDKASGKWYLIRDSVINWIDGKQVHLEVATEITWKKNYEEKLLYYASTDIMTGIHNRDRGGQLLNEIYEDKNDKEAKCLVFMDLDHLKKTNDTFGHEAGDRLILKIVELMKQAVGDKDILCRWGGDEFLIIIHGDEHYARKVMEELDSLAAKFNATHQEPFMLKFSYGIAKIEKERFETLNQLIDYADKKMYENKRGKADSGANLLEK